MFVLHETLGDKHKVHALVKQTHLDLIIICEKSEREQRPWRIKQREARWKGKYE